MNKIFVHSPNNKEKLEVNVLKDCLPLHYLECIRFKLNTGEDLLGGTSAGKVTIDPDSTITVLISDKHYEDLERELVE